LSRKQYLAHCKILIAYLLMKVAQEDWHAVRDACVDIETLEARHR